MINAAIMPNKRYNSGHLGSSGPSVGAGDGSVGVGAGAGAWCWSRRW